MNKQKMGSVTHRVHRKIHENLRLFYEFNFSHFCTGNNDELVSSIERDIIIIIAWVVNIKIVKF